MSRIGKSPIPIPQGLDVTIQPNNQVTMRGARGTLAETLPPSLTPALQEGRLIITRQSEEKKVKAFHGLYRALLQNMVIGLCQGYKKELHLVGVGYKVALNKNILEINVGKSHLIYFVIPPEVTAGVAPGKRGSNPTITLESNDKQLLGQLAAKICALRKSEPYKGKGIHLKGKPIRRKIGKKAAK